jgi:hypothetical protein
VEEPLERARDELRRLRATPEYAWARSPAATGAAHPSLAWVLERERELLAVIAEHRDDR